MQIDNHFRLLLKSLLVMVSFTFITSFTFNIERWQTITLCPKITVEMPDTPTLKLIDGTLVHQVRVKDSFELEAMIIDYGLHGVDEETLGSIVKNDVFLSRIVSTIKARKDSLIFQTKGIYHLKYQYFEIAYETNKNDFIGTIYQRYVFYKQLGLVIIFKVPKGRLVSASLQSQVYQSIKIEE